MSRTSFASIAGILAIASEAIGCGTARPEPPISDLTNTHPARPPAASTAESAPLQPPPVKSEPPAQPPSPFRIVAEFAQEPVLHDLGDRGLVSIEQELVAIEGDALRADESLTKGLPEPKGLWRIAHVAGKSPESAWLEVVQAYGSSGRSLLFRRRGQRWQHDRTIPPEKMFVSIAPWTGGRLLGVLQSNFVFDAVFRLVDPARPTPLPRFTRTQHAVSFCFNRVHAEAFTALPGGHAFVAGLTCDTKGDEAWPVGIGIERWEPGQVQGTVDMLPGMSVGPRHDALTVEALVALSPTEVYAAVERVHNVDGSPRETRLFRFDGKVWSAIPAGIQKGVRKLWVGREGTLWAADGDGQLHQRAHDGSWLQKPLPPQLHMGRVTSFWQAGDGGVWAVVVERDRSTVVYAPVVK